MEFTGQRLERLGSRGQLVEGERVRGNFKYLSAILISWLFVSLSSRTSQPVAAQTTTAQQAHQQQRQHQFWLTNGRNDNSPPASFLQGTLPHGQARRQAMMKHEEPPLQASAPSQSSGANSRHTRADDGPPQQRLTTRSHQQLVGERGAGAGALAPAPSVHNQHLKQRQAAPASAQEERLFAERQPAPVEVFASEQPALEGNADDDREQGASTPESGDDASPSVVESSSAGELADANQSEPGDEAESDASSSSPGELDSTSELSTSGDERDQQHRRPTTPQMAADEMAPLEGIHFRPSRESPQRVQPAQTLAPAPTVAPTTRRPLSMTQLQQRHSEASAPPGLLATTLRSSRPLEGAALPVAITTRQPARQLAASPSTASFDLNIGADPMMIKPANELLSIARVRAPIASEHEPAEQQQQHAAQPPVELQAAMPSGQLATSKATSFANTNSHELATESVNQHVTLMGADSSARPNLNERRQDFLGSKLTSGPYGADLYGQQQSAEASISPHSICYTPFSLLLVILITMLATVLLTYAVQRLAKYLKRHQFDLMESSKQFGHYVRGSAAFETSRQQATGGAQLAGPARLVQYGAARPGAPACQLHLLEQRDDCSKCLSGGAFRNPYFTDQQHPAGNSIQIEPAEQAAGWSGQQAGAAGLLRTAPMLDSADEQMHFIESHIANLHSRQVTSSVKELSSLGQTQPPTGSTSVGELASSRQSSLVCPVASMRTQVVDLTSREHRARVLEDPREGDLIAVDLSGHDIVGLGFDVCASPRDGIIIKSVHSRGPARESGAIQAGDRIKCLNVSFENVVLQDACDILNSAAPYKMRLLIEKRVLTGHQLNRLRSSSAASGAQSALPSERPTSPLAATKNYIKSWSKRLRGVGEREQATTGKSAGWTEEGRLQMVSPAPPIGSAAARQLSASRRGLIVSPSQEDQPAGGSHTNEAFSDMDMAETGLRNGMDFQMSCSPPMERQSRWRDSSGGKTTNSASGSGSFRDQRRPTSKEHKLRGPEVGSSRMVSVDLRHLSDDEERDESNREVYQRERRRRERAPSSPSLLESSYLDRACEPSAAKSSCPQVQVSSSKANVESKGRHERGVVAEMSRSQPEMTSISRSVGLISAEDLARTEQ